MPVGWSIGFDSRWQRDIGYGVPATCDHPDCDEEIDRGLSYVCCEQEPYGGESGCGLFFCSKHMVIGEDDDLPFRCERCAAETHPFDAKPDRLEWIAHKVSCPSWQQWRDENPRQTYELLQQLTNIGSNP